MRGPDKRHQAIAGIGRRRGEIRCSNGKRLDWQGSFGNRAKGRRVSFCPCLPALVYAGGQDWLDRDQKEGWAFLTRAGEALTRA